MAFTLTLLGVGSALPANNRNPSAQFLQTGNTGILIDCGEGTQMQLRKCRIGFQKIHHIFISHLHGDHYLGLMGLLWSMNLLGRKIALNLYGPKALEKIIALQLTSSSSRLDFELRFKALDHGAPEVLFENKKLTLSSFPLKHKIPCSGLLVKEKQGPLRLIPAKLIKYDVPTYLRNGLKEGRDFIDPESGARIKNSIFTLPPSPVVSYAYCSDTAFSETLPDFIRNVTVLYHEATFLEEDAVRAKRTKHSTAAQAATIAKLSNAGQLILGHYSNRYDSLLTFLIEAEAVFHNTILGEEAHSYPVRIPGK
jgi:ribonuclease Z